MLNKRLVVILVLCKERKRGKEKKQVTRYGQHAHDWCGLQRDKCMYYGWTGMKEIVHEIYHVQSLLFR